MVPSEMPSIKDLFKESWRVLKSSFGNIFALSIIGFLMGMVIFGCIFAVVMGLGIAAAWASSNSDVSSNLAQLSSIFTPALITQVTVIGLVIITVSSLFGLFIRLAAMVAIGNADEKPSLGTCLKGGLAALIPVFIVTSFISFATFGSWFLFIIPAILINFFFEFVTLELVLGKKKWFASLKGSVQIVSQHFGDILLRVVIYWVAIFILFYLPIYIIRFLVSSSYEHAPAEAAVISMFLSMYQFVVGILLGLYGSVYTVITYQHAKRVTDETIKPKMGWIWVTCILGWIVALCMGFGVAKIVTSPAVAEQFNSMMKELESTPNVKSTDTEKINTWVETMNPEAKPYWDQSGEYFKHMKAESSDPAKVKQLNDRNIDVLKKAIAIDEGNPELWSGLSDAYTWVSTKGTLEDSLAAIEKAKKLDPTIFKYQYSAGNVLLMMEKYDEAIIQLETAIRMNDNYGLAHIALGIAYKRSGLKDSATIHLQKGIDILTKYNDKGQFDQDILQARKELETVDQLPVKTTTKSTTPPPAASCINYQIREGEFASNKCYSQKDYDDLVYYLQQYNSAAFTYNGAVSSMEITCNGSDFFEKQCDKDKKTRDSAKSSLNKYKDTIKDIISRGK